MYLRENGCSPSQDRSLKFEFEISANPDNNEVALQLFLGRSKCYHTVPVCNSSGQTFCLKPFLCMPLTHESYCNHTVSVYYSLQYNVHLQFITLSPATHPSFPVRSIPSLSSLSLSSPHLPLSILSALPSTSPYFPSHVPRVGEPLGPC